MEACRNLRDGIHNRTHPLDLLHYSNSDVFLWPGRGLHLTETLLDPEFGHANEANKSAFSKAFNVEVDLWSWLERPDNRSRLARFGAAMNGLKNMCFRDAILVSVFLDKQLELINIKVVDPRYVRRVRSRSFQHFSCTRPYKVTV